MPLGSILATVAAYAMIALLLLSMNIASRWRWWIKGGAIVLTGAFFIGSYFAIASLLGWSTQARVPNNFSLIATRVVEPDPFTGDLGAIYLWIEEMNENNVPNGRPRSYRIAYTPELADTVEQAQDMLNGGEAVEGVVEEVENQREADAAEDGANPGDAANRRTSSSYPPIDFNLIFNDLPAVVLPEKGVL